MRQSFFFFNDTATTEIYTLSLHDALPIFSVIEVIGRSTMSRVTPLVAVYQRATAHQVLVRQVKNGATLAERSEEHTSELQSRQYLVCRLLLEKKKNIYNHLTSI